MKDEQMQSLLDMRYRDLEIPRPKVQTGVARVMEDVPRTRQQGRWWPLPAFDRPLSTFPARELAPAPIPATNGRQPARGFTMFSALKFISAAVIVALFGGFLLAGVFTTEQGDQVAPAAVTVSPEPDRTPETAPSPPPESTPAPLAVPDIVSQLGLEAKVAEPGVLLLRPEGGGKASKALDLLPDIVGRDGSLWRYTEDANDEDDEDGPAVLARFGERDPLPWKRNWAPYDGAGGHDDIQVAPDGTVWLTLEKGVASYDGTSWTIHHRIAKDQRWGVPAFGDETDFDDEDGSVIAALEMTPGGAVWVARLDAGIDEVEIYRFDDEWRTMGTFEARVGTYGEYESDFPAGYVRLATADEGVWLATADPLKLRRYHDGAWEEVALPADLDPITDDGRVISNILGMRAGPDGTLWLHTLRHGVYGQLGLEYYDGADWSGWRSPEDPNGASPWTPDLWEGGVDAFAPDGGIWLRDDDNPACGGVYRYVGMERTHHFLADRCVHSIVVTPDGDVWLTAGKKNNEASATTKLFLIPTESVAAQE